LVVFSVAFHADEEELKRIIMIEKLIWIIGQSAIRSLNIILEI